jgi:hypothetical protein
MMQGDAFAMGIRVYNAAGLPITPNDLNDVELIVDHLRKTYQNGELFYEDGLWFANLSQQETLSIPAAAVDAQLRIRWRNGVVEGKPIYGITMAESLSREVI